MEHNSRDDMQQDQTVIFRKTRALIRTDSEDMRSHLHAVKHAVAAVRQDSLGHSLDSHSSETNEQQPGRLHGSSKMASEHRETKFQTTVRPRCFERCKCSCHGLSSSRTPAWFRSLTREAFLQYSCITRIGHTRPMTCGPAKLGRYPSYTSSTLCHGGWRVEPPNQSVMEQHGRSWRSTISSHFWRYVVS